MDANAVLLEAPGSLCLRPLALRAPAASDVVVETAFSGISTGTEKLIWTGRMPHFPGLGYPLVPGYESVGRVVSAGADAYDRIGDWVFVPGANCYETARGLFGATASQLITSSARAVSVAESLQERGVLLSLAATAYHAIIGGFPGLIVGHGVLGRLAARLTIALGGPEPVVWEIDPARRDDPSGYEVIEPLLDARRDYGRVLDVSGDPEILDLLLAHVVRGGEIVLGGFYERPLCFAFVPAFMKEIRIRVAAEFTSSEIAAVAALVADGRLDLDGLVSHVRPASEAATAYPTAFAGRECLKMVLDWRTSQ